MPMHKSLAIKDKSLHRELKKLAAELDTTITDLVEDFIREGIKKTNGEKGEAPSPHMRKDDT